MRWMIRFNNFNIRIFFFFLKICGIRLSTIILLEDVTESFVFSYTESSIKYIDKWKPEVFGMAGHILV